MTDQLRVGLTFEKTITINESHVTKHLGGKGVGVFSTPEMVRLMEGCALEGVQSFLPPNQNTVGIRVEMRHLAATPMGMRVTVRCTLTEIDRRRLVFQAEVHDELDKVGEGINERFIVDADKHQQRLEEKVARWRRPA